MAITLVPEVLVELAVPVESVEPGVTAQTQLSPVEMAAWEVLAGMQG